MILIKISPDKVRGLCSTCREAQTIEYENGKVLQLCTASPSGEPLRITQVVSRCSDYDNKMVPSKWEMEKVAWTLNTDKSGKVIGFAPPKPDKD